MQAEAPKEKARFPRKMVIVSALVFIFLVTVFTFGDKGLISLLSLRRKAQQLQDEITRLNAENQKLRTRIINLTAKNNSYYVEKIAREELGLGLNGEQVYKYDTSNSATGESKN